MEEFHSFKINPIEILGKGAFGYVEKIELYNSSKTHYGIYAKKTLSPNEDILSKISMDEIKKRFAREVFYQSNCRHQNIIQIFLFNKDISNPYFIMEIGDYDLQTLIDKNNLSENEKENIIIMMLNATKKIHDEEYLHRDIKPQNIIRFPNGVYKLSDFGLVKNIDSDSDTTALTAIGTRMGTKKYMAPEILIEGEYSKQTDIYALGILFSELSVKNKKLFQIIEKCKKRDKDSRYTSVDEIIIDFKKSINTNAEKRSKTDD